jgi:hypothetical protein
MAIDDKSKTLINYTKEAFTLPINMVFLSAMFIAILVSAFLTHGFGTFTQLLVFGTAALEMLYLSLMPSSYTLIQGANARHGALNQQIKQQIVSFQYLQHLNEESLEEYFDYINKKNNILENLVRNNTPASTIEFDYLPKLENLEKFYIELLFGLQQYRLQTNNQDLKEKLTQELHKVETEKANSSAKLEPVYNKRIDLLKKRLAKFDSSKENMTVAQVQLDTIKDTIDFILEQSISINNQPAIQQAIGNAIETIELHQETLNEINSLLSPEDEFSQSPASEINDPSVNPNSRSAIR